MMQETQSGFPNLERLAPFTLRSRSLEVGRERLLQVRNKLAYLLITTDIAENSRDKALRDFPCPIFQALTMEEIARIFHYQGTKMLGFRRSPLSTEIMKDLRPYRITLSSVQKQKTADGQPSTMPEKEPETDGKDESQK